MRVPIKLNQNAWPKWVCQFFPSCNDPGALINKSLKGVDFSNAVSTLKFGDTFKSTSENRFPKTVNILKALEFSKLPVVLDIGSSDGISSLAVIDALKFRKYYVTDLNIEVFYKQSNGYAHFFDPDGNRILVAGKRFITYSDYQDAIFPLNKIAEEIYQSNQVQSDGASRIELINPLVKENDKGVQVKRFDIFTSWSEENPDLVIAANILNRAYFSDSQLKDVINNLASSLNEGGILAVIDNRATEQSTVFRFSNGAFSVLERVAEGTNIEALVLA